MARLLSWSIGCTLGTVVGLMMVRTRLTRFLLNPLIEGLRPIPPIALIPFVILWFGLGETGRIVRRCAGMLDDSRDHDVCRAQT